MSDEIVLPGPIPRVTTSPTQEPVSVSDMKSHLRVDHGHEDGRIADMIQAAREMVEEDAQVALCPQTLTIYLDAFPRWEVCLRKCPVNAISSITYVDSDGTTQTLSASEYTFDAASKPARLTPAYGETWPVTRPQVNAVAITATAGYTSPSSIPAMAKQAIKMLVAHWYENRETVLIGTISKELELSYKAIISRFSWGGYA
jgi:uncharacterized phiE125 gp8 family phage protein